MSRTQAERRHDTLLKLHEATVACIVNNGFSRLTTTDIARTAGMSQGALFRYYPTKTAAVVGATRYLFSKVMEDFAQLLGEGRTPDLTRLADDLWVWFASPNFVAISRLLAESSADIELKDAIQPIFAEHRQNTHQLIQRIFPEPGQNLMRTAAHAVIFLMQGLATEKHLVSGDAIERDILQAVRDLATLMGSSNNPKKQI
ncbi:MAG: TetR/AcrR family transcriptional regulator [Turneriella sp.]